ncbi:hypothetical protein CSB37_00315 [bacterium DOLZORAL124_38_8]|nr:MAG: hypothetical protein CSB37_00315 [bacterium DOLZORAL124_38_8]
MKNSGKTPIGQLFCSRKNFPHFRHKTTQNTVKIELSVLRHGISEIFSHSHSGGAQNPKTV